MTTATENVLREAMRLPEKDRAEAVAQLLASLDDPPDPDAEAAWAEEITRRAERVVSGESKGEVLDVVRQRIEHRLEDRR